MKSKSYTHGECILFKIKELPSGLNKIKSKDGRYIVANSESTGNHHCIAEDTGIEMYEKDGILYLKNDVPATLYCVDEKRHDKEVLEPGIWEIDKAREYDHLTEMTRRVVD